jgi:low temperature requirement protein LtrA
VPWQRRLGHEAWNVETSHFAERFQLFMIIALGESIVITGATTAGLELSASRVAAFALAFLVTAALWWLYFDYVARIAERRLELATDRTRLARDGYTYLHVVLAAGVIVSAVGDEIVIGHPLERLSAAEIAAVVAGPAIYLLGHALFRLRMAGSLSWKRFGGALACVLVGVTGIVAPALVVGTLVLAVLVAVIGLERLAAARRSARGEPSPLERLEPSATGSR